MPIRRGLSSVITAIKLGTGNVIRVRRGGLSVWPTTDSSTVSWTGNTSISRAGTDSVYWFYDEISIQLNNDGTWEAYFFRNGIGGGSPYVTDSGTWATPSVPGVGANYSASMTHLLLSNGNWSADIPDTVIDGSTLMRLSLRTNDAYPVTVGTSGSMRIDFRAVGISTVIYSVTINLAITA